MTTESAGNLDRPHSHTYSLVARRKTDVSEAQARSATALIGGRLATAFPDPFSEDEPSATAAPLEDFRVDPLIRQSAVVLLAAVGVVLLIGCVNLANLTLARGVTRQREVAIRLALGATRRRLVRQFLTESLLLAGAGSLAGLAVAYGALQLAGVLMPEASLVLRSERFELTRLGIDLIGVDGTTLLFTLTIAVVTAVLVGLMPAWHASRPHVMDTMKVGSAGAIVQGSRGLGPRNLLMAGETALAFVLLVGAGVLIQSVKNLQRTELGYAAEGLMTLGLSLPDTQYDETRSTRLFRDLLERVEALPGVQSTAYGSCPPLSGPCIKGPVLFPDRPPVAKGTEPTAGAYWVSPEYFRTMGIRLLNGRRFTDQDRQGQPRVALINETTARALFRGQDPLGQRIGIPQGAGFEEGAEVIGIVDDVRYGAVAEAMEPDVYMPLFQAPQRGGILFIRTNMDPGTLVPSIRHEVAALDPDLPVSDIKTMGARFDDATWQTRLSADVLTLFAALALLLAAIGVYGVMAQAVEGRTREIGVRMALGADRRSIFRLVIGRALIVTLVGIGVGVALSLLSIRFLEPLLYQVRVNDPTTLALLAAVLLAVTFMAAYRPARRATRVDPLTSLRTE